MNIEYVVISITLTLLVVIPIISHIFHGKGKGFIMCAHSFPLQGQLFVRSATLLLDYRRSSSHCSLDCLLLHLLCGFLDGHCVAEIESSAFTDGMITTAKFSFNAKSLPKERSSRMKSRRSCRHFMPAMLFGRFAGLRHCQTIVHK